MVQIEFDIGNKKRRIVIHMSVDLDVAIGLIQELSFVGKGGSDR